MDDLYTAVVQAVEEAVLNALVVNDDMSRPRRTPLACASARSVDDASEPRDIIDRNRKMG